MLHDDIGVHTYTHPSLSSLSNEQIFAELAFTMQIIHDSTGGRVPRIFRPPFGDTDMRVHSIAKVLGLTTIIWNQEWVLALSYCSHRTFVRFMIRPCTQYRGLALGQRRNDTGPN
jgi:peptidoglycan/xylan/chitin deacetylase (PgdA/CDA1 family)